MIAWQVSLAGCSSDGGGASPADANASDSGDPVEDLTIDAVLEIIGYEGQTIRVRGTNLHGDAGPTTARFIDSGDGNNYAVSPDVSAGTPDAHAPQLIEVTVPSRDEFSLNPPTPLVTFLDIEVEFDGMSDVATSAFRYTQ